MKFIGLLIFAVFSISCAHNASQNVEFLPTPASQSTSSNLQKEYIRAKQEKLPTTIKNVSRQFRISKLEKQDLPNDDLEIRLWRFSAFGDRDLVFILKRIDKTWSAELLESKISEKDIVKKNPPVRFLRKNIGQPNSSWENLWQSLVENEILTLPDGAEVNVFPVDDCWEFVVETKVENKYRVYSYFAPEIYQELREARQMIEIINVIAKEFNLKEFNADNFMKP